MVKTNRTYARHDDKWKEQTDEQPHSFLTSTPNAGKQSPSRSGCISPGKKLE